MGRRSGEKGTQEAGRGGNAKAGNDAESKKDKSSGKKAVIDEIWPLLSLAGPQRSPHNLQAPQAIGEGKGAARPNAEQPRGSGQELPGLRDKECAVKAEAEGGCSISWAILGELKAHKAFRAVGGDEEQETPVPC